MYHIGRGRKRERMCVCACACACVCVCVCNSFCIITWVAVRLGLSDEGRSSNVWVCLVDDSSDVCI